MKSSGKYKRWEEGECTLHRCPKSWETLVALDQFWYFKGIESIVATASKMKEYLSREEKTIVRNSLLFKKGKLELKSC